MAVRRSIYSQFGVNDPFDPDVDYITSPISFLTPAHLTSARQFFVISTIWLFFFAFPPQCSLDSFASRDNKFLTYLSLLPFAFLLMYFISAQANGVSFIDRHLGSQWPIKGDSKEENDNVASKSRGYALQAWAPLLQLFHVLVLTSALTFPLFVTTVFWLFSNPPQSYLSRCGFYHAILHAFAVFCSLFEILFTNTPAIPWLHFFPCASALALSLAAIHRLFSFRVITTSGIAAQFFVYVAMFTFVRCVVSFRILYLRVRGKRRVAQAVIV